MACLVLIWLLYSLNIICIAVSQTVPTFKTEPSDVEINEGMDATFHCSVNDFDSDLDQIKWEIQLDNYVTAESENYDRAAKVMTTSITVYDVGRVDQSFTCVVERRRGSEVEKIFIKASYDDSLLLPERR